MHFNLNVIILSVIAMCVNAPLTIFLNKCHGTHIISSHMTKINQIKFYLLNLATDFGFLIS
jgi:hypothetical protein